MIRARRPFAKTLFTQQQALYVQWSTSVDNGGGGGAFPSILPVTY